MVKKFPAFLEPKVYCCVEKIRSRFPVLIHFKPLGALSSYVLRRIEYSHKELHSVM